MSDEHPTPPPSFDEPPTPDPASAPPPPPAETPPVPEPPLTPPADGTSAPASDSGAAPAVGDTPTPSYTTGFTSMPALDLTPVPPPDYSPAPPPEAYGTPMSAGGGKKKTALLVAIVVGVLLLCCCLGTGAFFLFASSSDSDSFTADFNIGTSDEADADETARLDEWESWQPEPAGEPLAEAPTGKMELIEESLGVVAPDFEADDVFWMDGYYSADEDWYYADYVVTTARHPASDEIWAGIEFSIQSDQMLEEDVAFEPDEGDVVTTIAGGARELLYFPQWDEGVDESLWRQIAEDWPGAVVMDIYEADTLLGGITAEITTWDAYVTEGWSPRVYITYQEAGDGWDLAEWRYEYPDDEGVDDEGADEEPTGSPT
jgi:hypothetical protein